MNDRHQEKRDASRDLDTSGGRFGPWLTGLAFVGLVSLVPFVMTRYTDILQFEETPEFRDSSEPLEKTPPEDPCWQKSEPDGRVIWPEDCEGDGAASSNTEPVASKKPRNGPSDS